MLRKILALVRQQSVGFLALAVAVGGTAFAASSSQRRPDPRLHACVKRVGGDMRMVGARTRCLRAERKVSWNRQGIRGLQGLAGAPGAPGPAGQNGAPGSPGAPGMSGFQLVVSSIKQIAPNTQEHHIVDCPAGKRAVGGGGNIGGGGASNAGAIDQHLAASFPTGTAWFITMNNKSVHQRTMAAFAICVNVAD